jgi:hypothetical protein
MVKSAVAAMNAVQAVDVGISGKEIADFLVTGYSKRGWTTWLTAAVDNRIKAIVPGVIDVLNMDEQMMHHHAFYAGIPNPTPPKPPFVDGFSPAIYDYVSFNIPESVQTAGGQALGRIVDPYRYLNNGHFNIPKLILNSTGDEFFLPDSAQYYFHDLPGTQNYLRYIPNTGHGLDSNAATSTLTFYNALVNNLTLPEYSWTVKPDGTIRAQTSTPGVTVRMWTGTNPNYRDFRNAYSDTTVTWAAGSPLSDLGGGVYEGLATHASPTGATGYFLELMWPSPIAGKPYVFTTEVRVASNVPLGAWPFYVDPGGLPAPIPSADNVEALAGASGAAGITAGTPNSAQALSVAALPAAADLNGIASSLYAALVPTGQAAVEPSAVAAPASSSSAIAALASAVLSDWTDATEGDDNNSLTDDVATIDEAISLLDEEALVV